MSSNFIPVKNVFPTMIAEVEDESLIAEARKVAQQLSG